MASLKLNYAGEYRRVNLSIPSVTFVQLSKLITIKYLMDKVQELFGLTADCKSRTHYFCMFILRVFLY